MINQIRADLYRQSHSWGIAVTVILTAVYSFLIIWYKTVGGVMVNAPERLLTELTNKHWTVLDSVHAATLSSTVLLYLYITVFVLVIGYEFSQKIYKNTLVSGITRLQFILAKYVTLLVDLFILMTLYYGTAVLTALAAGRTWGKFTNVVLGETATTVLTTTFFISVVFSLAIFLMIATGSIVISSIFIVIWPIILTVISMITKWAWLKYVDFFSVAAKIAFGQIQSSALPQYLLVSCTTLILSVLAATALVRRKEL